MLFDKDTSILSITDRASERVQELVKKADSDVIGLRVGIKTAGCSGLQYQVEFAKEQKPFEDSIDVNGVRVLIDPAAVMFLIGSEMDWAEDKFNSTFIFNNPNETAKCGCGESFSVS
ncbi:iron-sulfur cluster assembly accessory protein [Alphaproteobacteria bacterium]|nr:iron-sulfur cluster assembly accessory protein [Alphaproteobacteria bacterium]MBT5799428.1 iron-sulfur cluster assembly accessory protein [Alphaproteobacteria bacterium]MDA9816347.1 iron-sulfur cluster assembly accessory protein [Alphaproteobacteria bacterium]MDC0394946.1 iron-sulfur cluster assembly accessory protein [Alphaproteobacteria bacterium]MDC3311828.1 iron-sulfur cluster assembly accessory protein [Alphaproteobacteria bacterium]